MTGEQLDSDERRESQRVSYGKGTIPKLSAQDKEEAYLDGLSGTYISMSSELSLTKPENYFVCNGKSNSHGSSKIEKEGKLRIFICLLGLSMLSNGSISRMVLNVSIVDMLQAGDQCSQETTTISPHDYSLRTELPEENLLKEEEMAESTEMGLTTDISESTDTTESIDISPKLVSSESQLSPDTVLLNHNCHDSSIARQNVVISAFFVGYMPMIILGGYVADRYGSKNPVLIATTLTGLINLFTPWFTLYSFPCLVTSRVLLGMVQGCFVPATYDLLNRWLTSTEVSIFAPMIKVSQSLGCMIGNILPGLLQVLGYSWPMGFYVSTIISGIFAAVWFILVTSNPQDNALISSPELRRISRKKEENAGSPKPPTPWFLILTNPSVIALTIVKLTYNLGIDWFGLELSIYMRQVHDAPVKVISAFASGASLINVLFISFVGWMAKVAVQRKALGFDKTAWRKIFQGSANFIMGGAYLTLPLVAHSTLMVALLFTLVVVAFMLGAGGESMVAFDLSERFPATIMGVAHSISILSGVLAPQLTSFVLGESGHDPERWNAVFYIIGLSLVFGGLFFVLVLKAEFFLPEERAMAEARRAKNKDISAVVSEKGQLAEQQK